MSKFITLTNDDGAAIYARADAITSVTERPARDHDALDRLIAAAEARLKLAEAGFQTPTEGDYHCGPSVDKLRREIEGYQRESETGVRGSTVNMGDHYGPLTDVRESAQDIAARLSAALG